MDAAHLGSGTGTDLHEGQPARRRPPKREVRLGLVLKGGVSLAIWMGGLVGELDALRRAGEATTDDADDGLAFWRDLTGLLEAKVVVDVLAGTSAGGINGALLATAIARSSPLPDLRDTWIEVGRYEGELLIRGSSDERRSILDGDYFLDRLDEKFKEIPTGVHADGGRHADGGHDVTLFLTGTALHGDRTVYTDETGQAFTEADNRIVFTFRRTTERNDFVDDFDIASERLARASRATASFPAAFEPVYVNATDVVQRPATRPGGQTLEGPNMSSITGLDASRWAVDGGVLDNEPFAPLLKEIARRPVAGDVDRVIAYIVPARGEAEQDLPSDDVNVLPRLFTAALSPFTLPRNLDILDDMARLSEMAQQADADRTMRRRLLDSALGKSLEAPAKALFDHYRRRRRDSTIWETRLLAWQRQAKSGIGLRMVPAPTDLGDSDLDMPWIPQTLEWKPGTWHWGHAVADRFVRALLGLVREGLVEESTDSDRRGLRDAAVKLSEVVEHLAKFEDAIYDQMRLTLSDGEVFTQSDRDLLALAGKRFGQGLRAGESATGTTLDRLVQDAARAFLEHGGLVGDSAKLLGDGDEGTARSDETDLERATSVLVNRYLHVEVVERVAAPTQPYSAVPRF
ncbi:MAG TPA: patatin-like protein, partial [Gaiellaceae bacterium]|nr:patatin-like protein [Gaiellaceae bacterium]